MEPVKLGKKGQVAIPEAILRSVGVREESPTLVEATGDGILLRPAAVYSVEMYSAERVADFERENTVAPELLAKVDALIRKKKHR